MEVYKSNLNHIGVKMQEKMAILFLRKFGTRLSGRPHSAERARTTELFDIRKMSLEGITSSCRHVLIVLLYNSTNHNRTLVIIAELKGQR